MAARAASDLALLRLAFAAAAVCLALPAHAHHASETDLKVAFAYNFIILSSWPSEVPPLLRFCVAGAAPTSAFEVLAGKAVRERTLAVVSIAAPSRAADCHILYIPAAESPRLGAWLAAVGSQPTLTISEQAQTLDAIVNLRLAQERIVFDVNTQAAKLARIVLSSQLVKLAATRQ